jgi:2-dehydro-3-deoxyphosphogalactonate aldolase
MIQLTSTEKCVNNFIDNIFSGNFCSPNCNIVVIKKTKQCALSSLPGVSKPTEAFKALERGADGLKIFPAELISPIGVKALLALMPQEVRLLPVGNIDHKNLVDYVATGNLNQ